MTPDLMNTGFIATELVKHLLEKAYNVIGTVRSLESREASFLSELADCFPGSLQLVVADVMSPNVFDTHVQNVDYVFQLASPYPLQGSQETIDVAVQGTENLLNSVIRHGRCVQRFVLASALCAAASPHHKDPAGGTRLLRATDWNEGSTVETGAYFHSKVLQERLAWSLAGAANLDLVAVLPSLTLGPFLNPAEDGTSLLMFKWALDRSRPSTTVPVYNVCDIRDVCKALIAAAEMPAAKGRYFVTYPNFSESQTSFVDSWNVFPETRPNDVTIRDMTLACDVSQTEKDLGLHLMNPCRVFSDSMRTALQLGFVGANFSPTLPR